MPAESRAELSKKLVRADGETPAATGGGGERRNEDEGNDRRKRIRGKNARARGTATTAGWSRATRAEKTPESFSNLNLHTKRRARFGRAGIQQIASRPVGEKPEENEKGDGVRGGVKSAAVFSLLSFLLLFIFSFFSRLRFSHNLCASARARAAYNVATAE